MKNFALWCTSLILLVIIGVSSLAVALLGLGLAIVSWGFDKASDLAIATGADGVRVLEAALRWHERQKTRT